MKRLLRSMIIRARKGLNIPTKEMRQRANQDYEAIYQYAKERRRERDRVMWESNDRNNNICPKCEAGIDEIVTKIRGRRSVPIGRYSHCESIEIQHCNKCGNEWERKGYSVRDFMMPFTEHDYVAWWVGFVGYCLKEHWEHEDIKLLREYTAEGWYQAFKEARSKTQWKQHVKSSLSTLRKYFPSVYDIEKPTP